MARHLIFLALLTGVCGTRPLPAGSALKKDKEGGSRYAYVMLAFDPPGASPRSLWGVLPMARALQELSEYPLVVLTNTTHFPDGTLVKESLETFLNVQVLPVQDVPVPDEVLREYRDQPCAEVDPPVCSYQYLKLQIWHLTQFDKLIWMDSDAILTKSIDGLFLQNGTWAQQDNWDCGSTVNWFLRKAPKFTSAVDWLQRNVLLGSFQRQDAHQHQSDDPCSGLLLLEPNRAAYEGLVQYIATLTSALGGDQQVITDYFDKVENAPLKVVDLSVASFGQCLDKVPGGKMPAFVHKSDWVNRCFTLGAPAKECRDHPLGMYWHNYFCSAAESIGLQEENINRVCNSWVIATSDQPNGYSLRLGDIVGVLVVCMILGGVVALGCFCAKVGASRSLLPRTSMRSSVKRDASGP